MQFLADENFPFLSIQLLREHGFDIVSIRENSPGISDLSIIRLAQQHQLIILTFDKDYGEILFSNQIINPPSIIFFRHKGADPRFAAQVLISVTKANYQLEGYFTVIEENNFRQRKL